MSNVSHDVLAWLAQILRVLSLRIRTLTLPVCLLSVDQRGETGGLTGVQRSGAG